MEYHLTEIDKAAKWVISQNKKLIAFKGDLGAGKTTLIKEVCKQLGVVEHLSSPSFALVNEYESDDGAIFHFDFYRLRSPEEALDFGLEDYFAQESYCLMEWPERIEGLLPEESLCIQLEILDAEKRRLKLY